MRRQGLGGNKNAQNLALEYKHFTNVHKMFNRLVDQCVPRFRRAIASQAFRSFCQNAACFLLATASKELESFTDEKTLYPQYL